MTEQIELSFIIPAYNEEDFIETTLDELHSVVRGKNLPYEIVVVDDGSCDNTILRAASYAKKNRHIKLISYKKNSGKGYAIKKGFMEANGEIVIFADGDMDIDLDTISKYIKALENADIVIASKRHACSRVQVPLTRRILSISFNILVRLLTGIPWNDTQAGLKAMRKNAFRNIVPRLAVKRYAFDVELLAIAHLCGLRVVEMPVNLKIKSQFKIKEVFRMFIDVLGIAYRLRIRHWYQRDVQSKDPLQTFMSFLLNETSS